MPTVRLSNIPIQIRAAAVARVCIDDPDMPIGERLELMAKAVKPDPHRVYLVSDPNPPNRLWIKGVREAMA